MSRSAIELEVEYSGVSAWNLARISLRRSERRTVSEFRLALEAIQRAADDAGLPVTAIDGIASYSNDRNDSVRVATALGLPELRFTNMFWGGGGGGGSGAISNAAAAIVAGFSTCVVVYRALAQGQFGRFGATPAMRAISGPIAYTW